MFVAKIEESDKAGGHQELNPGHLAWATSALPLSYDNWTTTPHNVQHRDKSWQPARCPGFNFQWLLAFAVSSIFASKHLNFTLFQHEARVLNIHINNIATFIVEVHAHNIYSISGFGGYVPYLLAYVLMFHTRIFILGLMYCTSELPTCLLCTLLQFRHTNTHWWLKFFLHTCTYIHT